jgi:hypothetical protein
MNISTRSANCCANNASRSWRIAARRLLLALPCVAMLAACAPIEPWVKPYERENLADPIMALDANPVSSAYLDHVFEVREAARGAMGGAGGGCGCN